MGLEESYRPRGTPATTKPTLTGPAVVDTIVDPSILIERRLRIELASKLTALADRRIADRDHELSIADPDGDFDSSYTLGRIEGLQEAATLIMGDFDQPEPVPHRSDDPERIKEPLPE